MTEKMEKKVVQVEFTKGQGTSATNANVQAALNVVNSIQQSQSQSSNTSGSGKSDG